ncbi:MAG: bifunctional riboflavin kinase/FAD synthetase, partial [Bacteroidota bacterium]
NDTTIKLLNTIDERIAMIRALGISNVVVKTFTKEFANMSARDYVKQILVDELRAKIVVIGYDHHFGKNRSANINDLKKLGEEFDFEVYEIPAQEVEDITVSSTKIRHALNQGHVDLANSYLGYDYFMNGKVIKGRSLGRTLDFPTANIEVDVDYKLIPKDGVYVVSSEYNNITLYGMMNIGTNPTVDGKNRSIEVHFFDFNDDIYGVHLKINFLKRLRDEQKFESVDLLKSQLKEDKNNAKAIINDINA